MAKGQPVNTYVSVIWPYMYNWNKTTLNCLHFHIHFSQISQMYKLIQITVTIASWCQHSVGLVERGGGGDTASGWVENWISLFGSDIIETIELLSLLTFLIEDWTLWWYNWLDPQDHLTREWLFMTGQTNKEHRFEGTDEHTFTILWHPHPDHKVSFSPWPWCVILTLTRMWHPQISYFLKPVVRLFVCPSVCPSVCLSIRPSAKIHRS